MKFNPDIHQLAPLPQGALPDDRDLAELAHRRHLRQAQACRKALHDFLHGRDGVLEEIEPHLREDIGLAPCGPRPAHYPDDTPPRHELG